jgi:hypothetical protein
MPKIKQVYFKLEGGVGNQLFQFAHAKNVANFFEYNGHQSIILYDDLSLIKSRTQNYIPFLKTNTKKANIYKLLIFRFYYLFIFNKCFLTRKFDSLFLIQKNVNFYNYKININNNFIYIVGNWMSESFFLNTNNYLKNIINFNHIIDTILNKNIISSYSVAIHIRRGDYLSKTWVDKLNVCNYEYYFNSFNKIQFLVNKKLQFFVFTNSIEDIEFIKLNYGFLKNSIFVTHNNFNTFNDFISMSLCKYFIISNSTYSWWASFISKFEDKIVIAPKKWSNDLNLDMKSIYLDNWVIINND